jgi:hypothetical protein
MNKTRIRKSDKDLNLLVQAGSDPRPDIKRLTKIMSDNGATPYFYVRIALKHLAEGNYEESLRMLHLAERFINVFFMPDTAEEKEFCVEMFIGREMFLFLSEKFRTLPGD